MAEALATKFGNLISEAIRELRHNRRLVVFVILLSGAPLAAYVLRFDDGEFRIDGLYIFVICGLVLLAFVQKYLYFVVCAFLAISNLLHMHVYRHWGGQQLTSRIEATFESPPSEMLEYLQSHVDAIDIAMLLFYVLYFFILIRTVFLTRHFPKATQKIALVLLALWLGVCMGFTDRLARFPPYTLISNTMEAKARFDLLEGRRDFLERNPLIPADCKSRYDKVVIIIGESAISDHMSLFGYSIETTPFAEQSKPYAFNALAPSNQTRYSIGMMLTSATPGHFDVFYREHSLVGQLRACGYDTLWISNQGRIGKHDSFVTSLALEADKQIFLNEWSYTDSKYDGQIVTELESRGIYDLRGHATFIHLMGSHVRYDKRYPEDFGFADSSDTVTEYDTSIRYTDFVLSELYKRFQDDSLLFIYVSDHGQFVSEKDFGSGFLPGYKEEYRIPLLVWTNDAVDVEQIESAIGDSTLNTESLANIVNFLIGRSASPGISTSRLISIATPENVENYDDLASHPDGPAAP